MIHSSLPLILANSFCRNFIVISLYTGVNSNVSVMINLYTKLLLVYQLQESYCRNVVEIHETITQSSLPTIQFSREKMEESIQSRDSCLHNNNNIYY